MCCRDPNKITKDYDDNVSDYSDYDEFSDDIDYDDMDGIYMDGVYMYNMKTPYEDMDNMDDDDVEDLGGFGRTREDMERINNVRPQTNEKLRTRNRRKKKKRRKNKPLVVLEPPKQRNDNRPVSKKNRSSLDFFSNG